MWGKNLVLSVYDKTIFSILSNGQYLLSHGGKQLPFPILNATVGCAFLVAYCRVFGLKSVFKKIEAIEREENGL